MQDPDDPTSFRGDSPAAAQNCELPDRRELALVAFERTRMPMIVTDPRQLDDPIVLANQSFLDLTGYTSEEVIGRNCRFLQGPATQPADIETMRTALARCDDNIEVELLNYRKDGTTFINSLDIWAVRGTEGTLLYYFASQKDVTAQREAEQIKSNERRLLMEVDHRAMNALEVVQSIARLSRADNVDGLSRAINRRISSLARAHRLLAERRWQAVDLKQLIEAQMSGRGSQQITLQGDEVQLLAHIVQPLGLVIHELISNAHVHGGLTSGKGRVGLTWRTQHADLVLHWREETHLLEDAGIEDGFGLQIVRTIVKEQLFGLADIDLRDGMFEAVICIPDAIDTTAQSAFPNRLESETVIA